MINLNEDFLKMKNLIELRKELEELENEREEKKILDKIERLKEEKEKRELKEKRDENNILRILKEKGEMTSANLFGKYVKVFIRSKRELLIESLLSNNKIKKKIVSRGNKTSTVYFLA